jgi:ABC-2 type transport system permease protein
MTDALDAAAAVMGMTTDELMIDPALLADNDEAVVIMARAMGVSTEEFRVLLDDELAEHDDEADEEQQQIMQERMMAGLEAAAEVLEMEVADLASRMGRIKDNPAALHAMSDASGFPQEMIVGMINQQLASDEMALDGGIDFNIADYLNLNLGIFLLMFAIAGISFLFSCVFNLTKNSLALGAGIPIAFLVFEIMSQASSDLEFFKYLSLNTLFDPSAITGGGTFIPQFIILAVLGSVLYLIGIKVFKEKDLPL